MSELNWWAGTLTLMASPFWLVDNLIINIAAFLLWLMAMVLVT